MIEWDRQSLREAMNYKSGFLAIIIRNLEVWRFGVRAAGSLLGLQVWRGLGDQA